LKIPKLHPLPDQIFVGFSGGADSTALLLLLHAVHKDRLVAIHFNHGIRPESLAEEVWCRRFCLDRKISFRSFRLELPPDATENEAREARIQQWKQLVFESGSVVALGHHQDDINENFFLRLMRGSGVSGLTGLRTSKIVDGIHFWRPLLNFHKQDLLTFLEEQGVKRWCEDLSNAKDVYRRNRVRHELLPLYENIAGQMNGLEASLQVLRQEAQFVEEEAKQRFLKVQAENTVKNWKEIPKVLMARILRMLVSDASLVDFIPSPATVDRVYRAIHTHATVEILIPLSSRFQLSIHHSVKLVDQSISSAVVLDDVFWNPLKESKIRFGEYTFSLSAKGTGFNCGRLQFPLRITTFKPGDRMQVASGMSKKLKKIFNEKKVDLAERGRIPVVWSGEEIIWVPSLARSKHSLPTENTEDTIVLSVAPFS